MRPGHEAAARPTASAMLESGSVIGPDAGDGSADERFTVVRSWPGSSGERIIECRDRSGRVRAAVLGSDGRVTVLPYATDPRLASLAPGGELLVHRAGRRAVQRRGDRFVKHLRRGRAVKAARVADALGRRAAMAGFAVPEILEVDDHSLTMTAVPGQPLTGLSAHDWRRAWDRWADLWPGLVLTDPEIAEASDGEGFSRHDAHAEAHVVADWYGRLRAHDAGGLVGRLSAELETIERRTCAELSALEDAGARAPVIAHRDLHDGQMLFDPGTGRFGLLDFDTAVLADRELDLGNLSAHIDLRAAQGEIDRERAKAAHRALGRVASAVGADGRRLAVYRMAARARLVCVYAFRPRWAGLAAALAEELAADRGSPSVG